MKRGRKEGSRGADSKIAWLRALTAADAKEVLFSRLEAIYHDLLCTLQAEIRHCRLVRYLWLQRREQRPILNLAME
jgi:hypothetical protein